LIDVENNSTDYGKDKQQYQRQRMQIGKQRNATDPEQPRRWKGEAQGAGSGQGDSHGDHRWFSLSASGLNGKEFGEEAWSGRYWAGIADTPD
jgi:hypothetical protein